MAVMKAINIAKAKNHLVPKETPILQRIDTRKYGYCAKEFQNNIFLLFGS